MSTIIGILAGSTLLILSIAMGGGWRIFLDLQSVMIVAGGTMAATLVSFPLSRVAKMFTLLLRIFREQGSRQTTAVIQRLVKLGHIAHEGSVFNLEKELKTETNRYIKLGLTMLVRNAQPSRMARRFAIEMDGVRNRHKEGIMLFGFMARIAPSFGLVGTLIGLINMLRGVTSDIKPEVLGPSMAVALITTLYGALMAFFLFLPASEKLKAYSESELATIQMVRDAMLLIKDGESSRDIEEMLNSYLPVKQRTSVVDKLIMGGSRGR